MTKYIGQTFHWEYFLVGLILCVTVKLTQRLFKPKFVTQESTFTKNCNNNEPGNETYVSSGPLCVENYKPIPYVFKRMSSPEILEKSAEFYTRMKNRRTVRHFSKEDVPIEVIHNIIKTAGTSPSGAHLEPWTFVVVHSIEVKQQIRQIVEDEEEINYRQRMGENWTNELKKLNTYWVKEYLTDAPYLILVFKQSYSWKDGKKRLHYYPEYSVAMACGMLIAAVQYAGLVALTSTPLNCGPALRTLLNRPPSEKLALLLPVGYPVDDCIVPDLKRKTLDDIMVEF